MSSSGYIFFEPRARPSSSNWTNLPNATYTFYVTETTTLTPIYSDVALSNPLPNPVKADSTGIFPTIYLDGAVNYRVLLKDENGLTLEDIDPGSATAVVTLQQFPQPQTAAEAAAGVVPIVPTFAPLNVFRYGATGLNMVDDWNAFANAISVANQMGGGDVIVPQPQAAYMITATLTLPAGVRLIGRGSLLRWRQTQTPCLINYTGSVACIQVIGNLTPVFEGCQVVNIQIDGTNAAPGTVGVYLNASGGTAIEGLLFDGMVVTNFPQYQVWHNGEVFDIEYRRCSFLNPAVVANDCVHFDGVGGSQVSFTECWASQYTAGNWCYNVGGQDVRFFGGTVAPYNATVGANGIKCTGGLYVYGTHVEGLLSSQNATVGIQYVGSNGAFISPSSCTTFGSGVVIGDGTSAPARSWVIAGQCTNNNLGLGTGGDVVISAGGVRVGVLLSVGFSNTPNIVNTRLTHDGVQDVTYLYNKDIAASGNVSVGSIGSGLKVSEGANAKQGLSSAMTSGAITVANTSVTSSSKIFACRQPGGANPGAHYVSAVTPATSFTITSTSNTDTGQSAWEIFEPA